MGKSVVGVRFKKVGKIYYFDPLDIEFEQFDPVIVETVRGIEYGEIALTARDVDEAEMVAPVKPVIRKATETDTIEFNKLKQNEQDAKAIFIAKAKKHKLEMKLIDVEYTFDQKRRFFILRLKVESISESWSRTWLQSLRCGLNSGKSECAMKPSFSKDWVFVGEPPAVPNGWAILRRYRLKWPRNRTFPLIRLRFPGSAVDFCVA